MQQHPPKKGCWRPGAAWRHPPRGRHRRVTAPASYLVRGRQRGRDQAITAIVDRRRSEFVGVYVPCQIGERYRRTDYFRPRQPQMSRSHMPVVRQRAARGATVPQDGHWALGRWRQVSGQIFNVCRTFQLINTKFIGRYN